MKKNLIQRLVDKLYKLQKRVQDRVLVEKVQNQQVAYRLNQKPRKEQVVVSLTSFGPRLATLDLPLKSIFRQRIKPDHLMIVLDDDPVCRAYANSHTELADAGVEFVFDSIGLKPHNKYYYAMQKYPDAVVITVDDDSIYRKDTVSSLLFWHKVFPKAICARRVHQMDYTTDGAIRPDEDWYFERHLLRKPNDDYCATGVGGVLYPPHALPPETFDTEKIQELCLCADDIWLKYMELLGDVKVFWVPNSYNEAVDVNGSQQISLCSTNNTGRNSRYIKTMNAYFKEIS